MVASNGIAAPLPAQTLKIDSKTSSAAWTDGKLHGTLKILSGKLLIRKSSMKGQGRMTGQFVIDLSPLMKDFDFGKPSEHRSSVAFFRVRSFTEVHNFVPGQPNGRMSGDLTILGITHPETIRVFFSADDFSFQAKGKLSLNRTRYELKPLPAHELPEQLTFDLILNANKVVAETSARN